MKISIHKIFLSFIFILCSFAANTQAKVTDSVKAILRTQEEDTNKVNTLIQLSKRYISYAKFKNKYGTIRTNRY